MKLNFGLLGIALAQSGDDYEAERHDYSYDYNLGNSHYSSFGGDQNYSFNNFGGKFGTGTLHTQARRLSCWNSNSLRDVNMDGKFGDHTGDPRHHYHHQYGFENAYYGEGAGGGSHELADFGDVVNGRDIDISKDDHSVNAADPNKWGYQSNNPDAKYHYGHHISDPNRSTNTNRPHSHQEINLADSFDGVVDDWRYSLRHAGCLYESPDFFYSGTTFNALRFLTYSWDDHVLGGTVNPTGAAPSSTNVHWVHVFNAHIHIDAPTAYCTATDHSVTDQKCLNNDQIHQFAVTMANPTYEGLGFINFVATYHDNHLPGTQGDFEGHRFRSNYAHSAQYENSGFWYLSTTGASVGTPQWHLPCQTGDCNVSNWRSGSPGAARGLTISSFPHNQLGKDFRFNIRTLHQMGDGIARSSIRADGSPNTAYSYFFYAISKITISFPEYVGHVNECWRQGNAGGSCTEDMIHQVIVDQSSVQFTSVSPQNTAGDIGIGNHQLTAKLDGNDGRCAAGSGVADTTFGNGNNCASWCHISGLNVNGQETDTQRALTVQGGGNAMCGYILTIEGMLSTYDELHLRQFGTIQEIWVQLMYAFSHQTDSTSTPKAGFESPFPNVFFSAPQTLGVAGECNGNIYSKCSGYARTHNVPYAGAASDGARWNIDADGAGGHRGDGFWVDDLGV